MIEVAVPMQKRVPVTNAKRCDEAVDSLADGPTAPSQILETLRSCHSQIFTAGLEDSERPKLTQNLRESLFVS